MLLVALLVPCGCSSHSLAEQSLSESSVAEETKGKPAEQSGSEPNEGRLELELIGYINASADFKAVNVGDIRSKLESGDNFFLYVGRPTCEWCRKIVPSLQVVFNDAGLILYYLDSTESESDAELSSFRDEYSIETVPSLIHFNESAEATFVPINLQSDDIEREIRTSLERAI